MVFSCLGTRDRQMTYAKCLQRMDFWTAPNYCTCSSSVTAQVSVRYLTRVAYCSGLSFVITGTSGLKNETILELYRRNVKQKNFKRFAYPFDDDTPFLFRKCCHPSPQYDQAAYKRALVPSNIENYQLLSMSRRA